jgi:hypothetical protein
MASDFQVSGKNSEALFTLKLHRGDGMTLIAMNWKKGRPPSEFVGFAIEYKEPEGDRFFALKNRLGFPAKDGSVDPGKAAEGLDFAPTHPKASEAYRWMGFEARDAILETLDQAIADEKSKVFVVAYDLNLPEIVSRLEKLGKRLKVIIDDSKDHGEEGSSENEAAERLMASAGADNVKRQHMASLQHNKTIVVDGSKLKKVVCGSTNFSWRGVYVQSNNALVLQGKSAVKQFLAAFQNYWLSDEAKVFGETDCAKWGDLDLPDIDAQVSFSPHATKNALLKKVADDIHDKTTSCLFYSLAFLYQTPGPIFDAIKKVTEDDAIFVYGISDREVGGIDLQKPDGNVAPVFPDTLSKNVPEPFSEEPTGGGGIRIHHKFLVIDFDKLVSTSLFDRD